jgi:hypothetical protein
MWERASICSRTDAYTEDEGLVRFSCAWRGVESELGGTRACATEGWGPRVSLL